MIKLKSGYFKKITFIFLLIGLVFAFTSTSFAETMSKHPEPVLENLENDRIINKSSEKFNDEKSSNSSELSEAEIKKEIRIIENEIRAIKISQCEKNITRIESKINEIKKGVGLSKIAELKKELKNPKIELESLLIDIKGLKTIPNSESKINEIKTKLHILGSEITKLELKIYKFEKEISYIDYCLSKRQ